MTFGKTVGNIGYTRSRVGEPTAGIAKSATPTEAVLPVAHVKVEAELSENSTYTLTVIAHGQSASVRDVHPDDLAEQISRLIQVVAKAARNGDLTKSCDSGFPNYGLGNPRANRDNLRFT